MHHKNSILIHLPITSEPTRKALRKHEDVVAACRAVPIRIVADDDLHGVAEIAANTWDVVGMVCDEVARGVDGDVKEMGVFWIGDADRAMLKETVDLDFCGVEVDVTAWVTDGGWVLNAFLNEVLIEAGGEWVDVNGEVVAGKLGLLPLFQGIDEGKGG